MNLYLLIAIEIILIFYFKSVDIIDYTYYNYNVLRGVAQMGARVVWDHEVAGSIPVTPTKKSSLFERIFYFL
jgi:hypothetical protein